MEHNRLKNLIEKYNSGTLDNDEIAALNDWFHSLQVSGTDFETWIKEMGGEDELAEAMLNDFNESLYSSKQGYRHQYRWIAAAAAIIIVLGVVGIFYTSNTHKVNLAVSQKDIQNDALPGGNKATLTLANGKQIALTKATIGHLLTQGNTAINHNTDGSVVYNTSATTVDETPIYNTLTTPRGGQYFLTLSDGTKVWLNAASSITYPVVFTGHERKVEITGEAYFEVVHNTAKPFKVVTNGQTVQDIGTHFNINAYGDEPVIKTTLTEGIVKVQKNKESLQLSPGQQARVSVLNDRIKLLTRVDTTVEMAWKNGLFKFKGAGVEEVMRQLSRWYDVDLEYKGNIPGRKFSGEITRNVNLSQVLEILGYLQLNFTIHQEGERTVITIMP